MRGAHLWLGRLVGGERGTSTTGNRLATLLVCFPLAGWVGLGRSLTHHSLDRRVMRQYVTWWKIPSVGRSWAWIVACGEVFNFVCFYVRILEARDNSVLLLTGCVLFVEKNSGHQHNFLRMFPLYYAVRSLLLDGNPVLIKDTRQEGLPL